jgi:DNA polymerase III subunit epsilon
VKWFTSWESIPADLKTKTQLRRLGLKLAPDQRPVAVIQVGRHRPRNLYDTGAAIPKRPVSEAQRIANLNNLQKARDATTCIDCGEHSRSLDDGRCPYCAWKYRLKQRGRQATEGLAVLAARTDWLIVDTETTGLDYDAEIVQIGIVDAAGQVLMNQLVRPTSPITPGATAVHGLDEAALANAPCWLDIYPEVARLLHGRAVLAYNADFDDRLVKQTCRRYCLTVPEASWTCVMKLVAAHIGEWNSRRQSFRWHKLRVALDMVGIDLSDEDYRLHDAAGDAWLTWRLVKSFVAAKAS